MSLCYKLRHFTGSSTLPMDSVSDYLSLSVPLATKGGLLGCNYLNKQKSKETIRQCLCTRFVITRRVKRHQTEKVII